MKDQDKTKEQMIEELENLRLRLSGLEKSDHEVRQSLEALRIANKRFFEVLNNLDFLVNVTDLTTYEVLFINRYGLETWGDIEGKICWQTIQKDQTGPCEFCGNAQLIGTDGQPTSGIVWEFQNTVNKHWYECQDRAIYWPDGRLVRLVIARDINRRKRAEEMLKESEERFRTFVECSPDAIYVQAQRCFAYVNAAAIRLFGATSEEQLLGKPVLERIHPDFHAVVRERIRLLNKEKRAVLNLEQKYLKLDEAVIDVEVSAVPFKYEKHDGALVFVRDITERKRMERERVVLSKLESMGILAGGIAHDFNNLLSVIVGNLDLAQIFAQTGKEMTSYLEAAKKAALEAGSLAQQLINIVQGGDPLKKLTALSGLLQEQVAFSLSGSPVVSEFSIPPDLWPVEVDESQISQVIRNIVLNAREAMPEGGVVSVVAANVALPQPANLPVLPGSYLKISISDQGHGIPEEMLPNVFDPYFSTKQRGTQQGMGLGLTICRSIIQKHGGALTIDTQLRRGTTLHVYLPALPDAILAGPVLQEVRPGKGRILVMDDEEMMRSMLGSVLDRLGYEVELVEKGEKAIESYQAAKDSGRPFDLVILDLTVRGGMGGQKTIRELLRIDPGVLAVVASGYEQDPVIKNCEQYGFKAAMTKPILISELSEILSSVIEPIRQ